MTTPDPSTPIVSRIARLVLNVRDLDAAVAFYTDALGFRVDTRTAGRARLAIGVQSIDLIRRPDAVSYPSARAANDPWFQHFAIAVADMNAAYARLARFSPEAITLGGPQLLPPDTGSVTAYKFRDPEGHPLELSHAPGSDWSRASVSAGGAVFLGIDHTAFAVRDLEVSIRFYTGLGFRLGDRSLNQGPEQARLDGLDGATVDIATLFTPEAGPHVELLHYRSPIPSAPRGRSPRDIAATETMLVSLDSATAGEQAGTAAASRSDPDGHLLRFISRM